MWRISALDREGREIGHFELGAGELTIGRDADRQLVLPSASVSRRHARIIIQDGRPCIVDEGSSNGVLINGVRIGAPTAVGPTTRIDVAEFRIAIEALMPASSGAPLSEPIPIPPASVGPPQGGPSSQPQIGGLRLVAEGGPYDGRVFNLPLGVLRVGRAVDNDFVFDDPSLSRHHANIHREGSRMEIEDLGSSNGSFVNGRKVGRGAVAAGDLVRFGDLNFRCEGGEHGSTRSVGPGMPRTQLLALAGSAAMTFLILVLAIVFLIRKVPPVQASGRDAIARIAKNADGHLQTGKRLYQERKYADAKAELDQAVELDPANLDARKLSQLAAHGTEDDRASTSAMAALTIGDRRGLENAIKAYADISEGAQPRTQLGVKLVPALTRFANEQCARKAFGDCAWALCRAFELAPSDARPSAASARLLRDADKKARKDRAYTPCHSVP